MIRSTALNKLIQLLDKPKKMHSGQETGVLVDAIAFISDPLSREYAISVLSKEIDNFMEGRMKWGYAIFGIDSGGAILGALVAHAKELEFYRYRPEDEHLLHKDKIGHKEIILVDDVSSTGTSIYEAEKRLVDLGHKIVTRLCLVDREQCKSI